MHISDVPLKPSYLHRFLSKKCFSQFCRETTNKNYPFSKWETWIFNVILDRTKLWRVLLWIRIKIMSAVTLNLSIDSILIKLLCRLVNFEDMKKKIYKMIFKKRWWKGLKILPPKSRILGFFSIIVSIFFHLKYHPVCNVLCRLTEEGKYKKM